MPAAPPRDENGTIVPHDHSEILDDHFVLRYIVPPQDLHPDPEKGVTRVSSGAYSEGEFGMSVDILSWMAQDGLYETHYLPDESFGARKINVGFLRGLGMKVGWDPDNGHRHHGAVWGVKQTHRKKIVRIALLIKKAEGET